jgi:uncharacterized protein (DUF2164 family)
MPAKTSRMRIELTDERRERIVRSIRQFFHDRLDQDLSEFQAGEILDFFVGELGAPVYNQAIRDAHAFLEEKLTDLEGEFYEPEESYSR